MNKIELMDISIIKKSYSERLTCLEYLAQEEEILPPKEESKRDFLKFLASRAFPVRKASLTLCDNGSLRATWKNEKWRLGMEFQGNENIRYVLLDLENIPKGTVGRSKLNPFSITFKEFDLKDFLTV